MSTLIDHKALAISRLATQFKESTNLINYIRTLLLEADNIESVYRSLLEDRWIDTAYGINLDILGAIVGQPRVLVNSSVLTFFGFQGALGADGFGDDTDSSKGSRFVDEGEPTTGNLRLADEEYRLFIRARVRINSSSPTSEEVAESVRFLFGIEESLAITIPGTKARIYIGELLNNNEKVLLTTSNLIPRPAGVAYEYVEYNSSQFFSFSGFPGAKGFADESTPTIGGQFANEI